MKQNASAYSLAIPYRLELLPVVCSFVGEVAAVLGANEHETHQLRLAAEEVFSYIMEAFPASEKNEVFDLQVEEREAGVSYRFSNHGTPINVRRTPDFKTDDIEGTLDGLGLSLAKRLTDEFACINGGNDGWSIVFTKQLAAFNSLRRRQEAESIAVSEPPVSLRVRRAEGADAEQLIDLIYRTYRYSYAHDEFYDDKNLRDAIEQRKLIALVTETEAGKIIGAGLLHFKSAQVVELGGLMTSPDYRNTRAVALMVKELFRLLREDSFRGLFFCAYFVTTHDYSQRLMNTVKMATLGLSLSINDRSKYIGINEERGQRESYVFAVRKTEIQGLRLTAHAPQEHQEIIGRMLDNIGISCDWAEQDETAAAGLATRFLKTPVAPIKLMDLKVVEFGTDFAESLKAETIAMQQDGFLTCMLFIPLEKSIPCDLEAVLKKNKFFFSGLDLSSDGRWYLRYTNLFHQRFQFAGLDLHDQMAKELCAYMEKEYVSLY